MTVSVSNTSRPTNSSANDEHPEKSRADALREVASHPPMKNSDVSEGENRTDRSSELLASPQTMARIRVYSVRDFWR
jgi:hypothetical protein